MTNKRIIDKREISRYLFEIQDCLFLLDEEPEKEEDIFNNIQDYANKIIEIAMSNR